MSCLLYLGNDVHLFWLDYMTQYVILKLGQIYICNMLISIFSWFFHTIFKYLTEQILYPKYNRMHLFASFWKKFNFFMVLYTIFKVLTTQFVYPKCSRIDFPPLMSLGSGTSAVAFPPLMSLGSGISDVAFPPLMSLGSGTSAVSLPSSNVTNKCNYKIFQKALKCWPHTCRICLFWIGISRYDVRIVCRHFH